MRDNPDAVLRNLLRLILTAALPLRFSDIQCPFLIVRSYGKSNRYRWYARHQRCQCRCRNRHVQSHMCRHVLRPFQYPVQASAPISVTQTRTRQVYRDPSDLETSKYRWIIQKDEHSSCYSEFLPELPP